MMERKVETPIFSISITNLQMKRLKTLIIIIIAAILVISIVNIVINTTRTVVIYSGLDNKKAREIISILNTNKIYNDYNPEMGTIAVKEKDTTNVVMALAMKGYPKTDLNKK